MPGPGLNLQDTATLLKISRSKSGKCLDGRSHGNAVYTALNSVGYMQWGNIFTK